jgi:hypothetical protein
MVMAFREGNGSFLAGGAEHGDRLPAYSLELKKNHNHACTKSTLHGCRKAIKLNPSLKEGHSPTKSTSSQRICTSSPGRTGNMTSRRIAVMVRTRRAMAIMRLRRSSVMIVVMSSSLISLTGYYQWQARCGYSTRH